jgi:SIR2-like domain
MDQVFEHIKLNKPTLFLGAGCSMEIGGPSGNELLNVILNRFFDVEYSNGKNFFDVCEDIIDSKNHSRLELEEFIKKQLDGLYPREQHFQILSFPWKCIFTTNYDMVFERILPYKFPNKSLRVVKENKPEINLRRYDLVHYIKILGSIDSSYGEEGNPILSRTDYHTSFLRRESYYQILGDCAREGPIIFMGYSFEDNLVLIFWQNYERKLDPSQLERCMQYFLMNQLSESQGFLRNMGLFISKALLKSLYQKL